MSDFTPHEAPARSAKELPVTVPPKLVGRDATLAQVYGQLKQGNPILLYGESGVGKTALAATLANAYTQQAGGVLWFNVSNPRLETLLVNVGRAYGVREIINTDNPVGMLGAVENTLTAQKPLIVLDGVISADTATRFITRCVSNLPTMIVSDRRLEGPWAAMEVPALETAQAVALYKQESRSVNPNDDPHVAQIVDILDHSALAIMVASKAMLASKQSPENYLKILQQISSATGNTGASVALTASFKALTGALQGILFIMGSTFSGEASPALLSKIGNAPADTIKQAMNIMSQLKLVEAIERYGEPYYRLHPIVHNFIQALLSGSNRLDNLQQKVRDTIIAYASENNDDSEQAHTNLAREMDVFLSTAEWARENEQEDKATELATAIQQAGNFPSARGYVYEALILRGVATGPATPFSAYDEDELSQSGSMPAVIMEPEPEPIGKIEFDDDDDYEESDEVVPIVPPPAPEIDLKTSDILQLRTVLAQYKQSGDVDKQIEVLEAIGTQQVNQSTHNEAVSTYNEVLSLYEGKESNTGILETLDMLSALMVKNDNAQPAITNARRGVQLAEELDDDIKRMHFLTTLGDAHQGLGESNTAIQQYSSALEVARNIGDTQNEAIVLYKLGYAQVDGANTDVAINTLEQALELFKAQEKREYEGKVLSALGTAYGEENRWSEAISFHTSGLHIAREVQDKTQESEQLASLGYANVQANQLGQAVLRYRQALHLGYEGNDKDSIVSNLVDLARLLIESKKHLLLTEMLIEAGIEVDANDPDLKKLQVRVTSEKMLAQAYNVEFLPIKGSAQTYASNAYTLLEN